MEQDENKQIKTISLILGFRPAAKLKSGTTKGSPLRKSPAFLPNIRIGYWPRASVTKKMVLQL
jgi:hypothetical protein